MVFAAYTRALERHPLLTKVITSTVLFGAGDLFSQKLEGKPTIDTTRLARMAAWGAIFTPLAHVWYNQLDKMIPGSGATVVASKVLADQVRRANLPRPPPSPTPLPLPVALSHNPPKTRPPPLAQLTWTVFINCGFFWTTTVMETGDSNAGIQKIKDKLWPTLKVNWVVWPVLQGINLSVVPLQFRILYINFASLFWSAYLSGQTNSAPPAEVKTLA